MLRLNRMAQGNMHDLRAIIDIGSNSVRLVIFGGPPRAPVVLFNEKVTAKLGKGVAENGALSAKAMAATLSALRRYAALLRIKGVNDRQCVATAAVRDASNGAAFLKEVAALQLKPRLLTGEEEALASAGGVIAAFPGARGTVADLGGGSLELVDIDGTSFSLGSSLPLGTLRLPELRASGDAKFAQSVRKILGTSSRTGDLGQPLYLVGGSWRTFARFAMHRQDWPIDDPHGFEFAPDKALALVRSLIAGISPEELQGVSKSRLASLPDAAALLGVLVRKLQPSKLIFSSWGLREGLLNSRLPLVIQDQDPLLAGVANFCEIYGISASTASMVVGWTTKVNTSEAMFGEPLRLSATLLTLASMQIEPNMRAEQVTDWALRKRWIGVDARSRAMLAMTALANTGRTAMPARLSRLASPEDLHEAIGWGLAIRLCRKFSGCSPDSLSSSALTCEPGLLVLTVRQPFDVLVSNVVERDLALLANWSGREGQVNIVAANAPIS